MPALAARLVGWLGLLGLLAACSRPREVLFNCDFEQFDGWVDTPRFLTTEQAHSGLHAYRAEMGQEYGATFAAPLSDLCKQLPRRLRVSSWVYLSSGRVRSTMLITQISCHGRRPDIWQPLAVDEVVPRYGKWEQVDKLIRLPADLEPTDELKLYVWHVEANGETTYFDDIRIEGWP